MNLAKAYVKLCRALGTYQAWSVMHHRLEEIGYYNWNLFNRIPSIFFGCPSGVEEGCSGFPKRCYTCAQGQLRLESSSDREKMDRQDWAKHTLALHRMQITEEEFCELLLRAMQ